MSDKQLLLTTADTCFCCNFFPAANVGQNFIFDGLCV